MPGDRRQYGARLDVVVDAVGREKEHVAGLNRHCEIVDLDIRF